MSDTTSTPINEVLLNDEQVDLYLNKYLILKSHEGRLVGLAKKSDRNPITEERKQEAIDRLRLFEVLFAQQGNGIALDQRATMGFADLLTETIKLLKS
jgi:hypothetical protein